ncbi:iron-sulfur cluster-binding domain-containing protein [Rufibacter immobilis]|uniref:Iron-sulfur cluster-binding domain-containing protein n=1 Tax=Rufibacter immobilis TaxID=1348778 RepID=A0A3M9MP57_9BACT|nr:iron-sulfur cluster-binding domain-containing protein [Rufibacter immobilis]RNI27320.1 iron-sulfur cluster-binding domain-containing protein [Rufibacter immobilis]
MNTPYLSLTITQIIEEIPEVKTFVFGGADAQAIRYQPGQYLTLVAHDAHGEVRRSYSITSAPAAGELLSIGVKRIENGFLSRQLIDHARVGDTVQTIGAAGFFTLPEDLSAYGQIFFWAAGSGITPIYSLIKTLLHTQPNLPMVLVYSNHSPQTTIYRQELIQLAMQYPAQLQVRFIDSVTPRLAEARLHRQLLEDLVRQYAVVSPDEILCYVCGPENYRRLCLYGLREVGVPADNIRQETFSTTKVVSKITPPDTAPHSVEILYQGQVYPLQVQYPDTILQAARNAGLMLPYSCEAGRCGNCAATCLEGNVWMSYNEVLTDRDLARGLTLTCVGYPVGGDVKLEVR